LPREMRGVDIHRLQTLDIGRCANESPEAKARAATDATFSSIFMESLIIESARPSSVFYGLGCGVAAGMRIRLVNASSSSGMQGNSSIYAFFPLSSL
jgi:hypothetical protein